MSKEKIKKIFSTQEVKFFFFSISAALVEIISFFILRNVFKINIEISQSISIALSVIYNFTINRKYTFKSTNNIYIAMLKVAIFYIFFIPFSAFGSKALERLGIPDVVIKTISLLLNGIGEFLWWKYVVFYDKNEKKNSENRLIKKENSNQ